MSLFTSFELLRCVGIEAPCRVLRPQGVARHAARGALLARVVAHAEQNLDHDPVPDPQPPASIPSPAPTLRLDHFLKREVLVGTGGNAKQVIQGGLVEVNGQVETRRKRQLHTGDVVRFDGREHAVGVIVARAPA